MQTFEKITKKFALSNSYFKNKRPQDPQNPFQVLEYYQQHGELPYKEEPHENWFYECFIEYQKKNTIVHSQFFTPTKTAQEMAQILSFYANEEDKILEACCGFGQITKALIEKGFKEVAGFDIDKQMISAVNYFHGNEAHFFTADFTNYFEKDLPYKTYDFVISNPPYEVKELILFLEWLSNILNENGKAVLLIPLGYADKTTKKVTQIFSRFKILERHPMQEEFARTNISAEIVVLERL